MKDDQIPPYNTGKVLIGSRYERPRRTHTTSEEVLWQLVALGAYQKRRRARRLMLAYVVTMVLVYIALVIFAGK